MPVLWWPLGRGAGGVTPGDCPVLDVPVLAVADNADGTGGTATITGATAGTTNTLWAWPAPTAVGSLTRAVVGSRVGNGAIAIGSPGALALGGWLFMVESRQDESVEASNLVYQPLTDATAQSVWDQCLDAVVTQVAALGLSGVAGASVVKRWLPRFLRRADEAALPMVVVAPVNSENFPGTLTTRDDVGYPVAICFIDRQNKDYSANLTRNLMWRQQVSRAFRFQRLAGVPEIFRTVPEPRVVVDPRAFEGANLFFSVFAFRFVSREERGV